MSEAELAGGLAELYGLDRETTGELLADLWDWYAGELNTGMVEYLWSLRPRYRTAILSNAAAGGRRVEQARYGFDELADVLVYSYEVGMEKPDPRIYLLTCELRRVLRAWLGSLGFAPRGAEVGSSCIGGPCDGFGAP